MDDLRSVTIARGSTLNGETTVSLPSAGSVLPGYTITVDGVTVTSARRWEQDEYGVYCVAYWR